MRERGDAEESERPLRFPELDIAEKYLRSGIRIGVLVSGKGRGDEIEFGFDFRQLEFGFRAEMRGVEEDNDGVGARRFYRGKVSLDAAVGKVDHSGFGFFAERFEFGDEI